MLTSCFEQKIFKFVHFTLGHSGVDKCVEEIKYMLHVRNLGRNLRKFIAHCDVCVNNVSILTGHSQLKRDIIYLRNQEIYLPLIYMGAYLHEGE
jgi:hypothetical protein